MPVTPKVLHQAIEASNQIDKSDLKLALTTATHLGCSLSTVLLGRGLITPAALGEILASLYKVPFIDLETTPINPADLALVPETLASQRHCIVVKKEGSTVHLAMEEPGDLETQEMIRKSIGSGIRLKTYITTEDAIKKSLKLYGTQSQPQLQIQKSDASAIEVMETMLEDAIRDEVSDIHLEPLEKEVLIRFRIDGVLIDRLVLGKEMHNALIARVKILAELKIDEHRLPQDGQFAYQSKRGSKNSFRVSIVPTVYGEKIVLRLLEDSLNKFTLEELGLLPEDQEIIEHTLKKTHGMFLLTGPTGSGKTTSLYTMLGILNQPQVNIVTIEDPVENRLPRVNQIQINPTVNLTFANGLRSVLRQDPDIIMVGEIRDRETALIAVNSAMTGHLVCSSVHANSAAGVIPRMFDLGIEPFLLASTLNLIVAQRLVRNICSCAKEVPVSAILLKQLAFLDASVSPVILDNITHNYQPQGCSRCNFTGYKGRSGIFEVLAINDDVLAQIAAKATSSEIWKSARSRGVKTMLEDGLIRVAKGQTTIEEVIRVIA
jgi:type IV pilus assembly protein PilB